MEKGGSKLMQMQARFQQKQMQEREMKIASLYEAQQARALGRVRHSPSESLASPPQPAPPAAPHQPGKVRQMFEERRTKGIDKSYPLQPINNTERARKPLPNGFAKVTSTRTQNDTDRSERRTKGTKVTSNSTRVVSEKKNTHSHSVRKQQLKTEQVTKTSSDLNHNHQPDLNAVKNALANGSLIPSMDELDGEGNMLEDETFPESLAPVTPREPDPPSRPPRRSPTKTSTKPEPAPAPTAPPRRSPTGTGPDTKSRGSMAHRAPKAAASASRSQGPMAHRAPKAASSGQSKHAASESTNDGVPCSICGRRFAADRLATHENICRKAQTKKRKPFDVLKHRLAGTEAEPFISKLRKKKTEPAKAKPLNSGWRQKHEEFIAAIRAAKQVQQHLNAGGKLSDLPPPPPSENPDYVPCPHCGRRFNQAAADRHIPKCASFQFNKPKPAQNKPALTKRRCKKRRVEGSDISCCKLSDLPLPPPSENPDYVPCPHCGRRFNQAAADRHIPKCASYQFNKPKPAQNKPAPTKRL